MNATHFFERHSDRSLPPSSESFWTAVFALFALYLARHEPDRALPCWQPTSQQGPPWYERKPYGAALRLRGLTLDGLAVEPRTVMGIWPEQIPDITLGGISPDLVLHLPGERRSNLCYALIENKIMSGAFLNLNQLSIYPEVIKRLCDAGIDARLFVLHSVGCDERLYDATKSLLRSLGDQFAILLWEDVFRLMERTRFSSLGVDPATLQIFTEHAKRDCREWETQ